MMMKSVFLRTLHDRRFFMLGWAIGFMALAALMTSFFPAMRQTGTMDALVESMPPAFKGLVGDLALLNTFSTYLASQLFDIRVPLIAGIMAIILGLGLSVSDEEKGELRTMLSLPISRTKLFIERWLAMVVIVGVTVVGLLAGVYIVMPFIDGASLDPVVVLRLAFMTWLIMVTFGTIPFALGYMTGRRGLANFVAIIAIIGSFLLSTFGPAVDWLEKYEKLSLLHYFPAVDIAKGTLSVADITLYTGITAALFVASLLVFRRRDIG